MNQTALITGAATRIGKSIAMQLATDGYNIIVHYNQSQDDAHKLCAQIIANGGEAKPIQADLKSSSERNNLINLAILPFGPLSVLINNASIYEPDTAQTLSEELWDNHFDLHAKTPIFLARDFSRQLAPGTKGNIINIIDERVLRNHPGVFSYNLSKSVLWTATKTLAQSFAPDIRVNAIGPGPTLPHTRQSAEQFRHSVEQLPLNQAATPQDIAVAVMFLLSTPSMTGQMLALDGGEHLEWRGREAISPVNLPTPK